MDHGEPKAENPTTKLSILMVDDQSSNLSLVQRLLLISSIAPQISIIETASDGQEALDKLKANKGKFNVVITDGTMPKKDGLDLADEIRNNGEDIVVGLISGGLRDFDLHDAGVREQLEKEHGISAVLPKPYEINQFQEFAGKIKQARELRNQPKSA